MQNIYLFNWTAANNSNTPHTPTHRERFQTIFLVKIYCKDKQTNKKKRYFRKITHTTTMRVIFNFFYIYIFIYTHRHRHRKGDHVFFFDSHVVLFLFSFFFCVFISFVSVATAIRSLEQKIYICDMEKKLHTSRAIFMIYLWVWI